VTSRDSLVPCAVVFEPPVFVSAGGVVVGPVDAPAAVVVFVFAFEGDVIPLLHRRSAELQVVRDFNSHAFTHINEKLLMSPRAVEVVVVIGQNVNDLAGAFDDRVALLVAK